jgi:hypothetical protein
MEYRKLALWNSHGYWMTMKEFIEIEVEERGNYTLPEIRIWMKKYHLTPKTEVIWVCKEPWQANRYNLPADDWQRANEIEVNEGDVQEIGDKAGFIIEESDDGDDGYLFVRK